MKALQGDAVRQGEALPGAFQQSTIKSGCEMQNLGGASDGTASAGISRNLSDEPLLCMIQMLCQEIGHLLSRPRKKVLPTRVYRLR